jgi:uncharacterized protein YneF (UPF0154 family)
MADTKKVVLWIVGGCGVVVLLAAGTCVGVAYYAKSKMESKIAEKNPALADAIRKGGVTGALKGGAGQMVAAGVAMYGGTVMTMALPPSEQKANGEILEKLVKVGPLLSQDEIQQLSKAMERTQKAHQADKSLPTADEARDFFAEVKAIVDRH